MSETYKIEHHLQLINGIKNNNSKALKELYISNYPKIETLVLKNNGTKDHAKDIYQDAFLVMWNNVKQDIFVPQTKTSINGYLYTIAKNKWMDYLRSNQHKKTTSFLDINNFNIKNDNNEKINDDILSEKRLKDIMHAFKELTDSCKLLLKMFYYEKKSLKTIALKLNITDASARNKKYRCMQKLRELVLASKK